MRMMFTTGQIAKICKVAPATVSKWFDTGRLQGFTIPATDLQKQKGFSGDRRIPREHLIRFLKEHGMPMGALEDELGKLLLVGVEGEVRSSLLDLMPSEDYTVETANDVFFAGIQVGSFHPDCIVIDFGIGRYEAMQIARNLRKNEDYEDTVLVALLNDDSELIGLHQKVFNDTFRKPFDAVLLSERIRTLVGRKKELA